MSVCTTFGPMYTDLYELTMSAGYWEHGKDGEATFSLYLRHQPQRGYYVAAGLASALAFLDGFRFRSGDIEYLNRLEMFKNPFLSYLQALRFTGDVWALPEGCIFFPDQPILEITAPLIQAQLVETGLINIIGLHSLMATKAARCVHAAQGRRLIDFSSRRTQGVDAGLAVARSTYLTGFEATSNVLAGKIYGIPVAGTMAHSFVQAFDSEKEAFGAYAETFPDRTILLLDTYDTIGGARQAVKVAHRLAASGKRLVGVRLDSGDMVALSCRVRRILDGAGLQKVEIIASGGFDEFRVAESLEKGAAIDAFGIGTKVGVSADRPYLDLVYKMVRYDARNVQKYSPGKETLAAPKQLFRFRDAEGFYLEDILGHRSEEIAGGEKLLSLVMKEGRICRDQPQLEEIRSRFKSDFKKLRRPYKQVDKLQLYPVKLSRQLKKAQVSASA